MELKNIVSYAAIIIAVISAVIAYKQSVIAKQALKDASLLSLFSGFERANQATIDDPNLLIEVHGLKEDNDLKNIAYLSSLMDSFQHYYAKEYNGNYNKLLTEKSTFLNKLIKVKKNFTRWEKLKSIYYGDSDFDRGFIKVIDTLFRDER